MKVIEVINRIDNIKPNTYSQADKILWLSELDGRIKSEIIDTHMNTEGITYHEYNEDDTDVELIAKEPYSDMYIYWLESCIDYANGEIGKYQNSKSMYNSRMADYTNHYNRTHMPTGEKIKYF